MMPILVARGFPSQTIAYQTPQLSSSFRKERRGGPHVNSHEEEEEEEEAVDQLEFEYIKSDLTSWYRYRLQRLSHLSTG